MKYSNILLDFDGTVCDSAQGVKSSFAYTLKQYGIEISSLSELDRIMGPPLEYSFHEFYSLPENELENAISIYRKDYEINGLSSSKLFPGMKDMLEDLRKAGKKVYTASSKPTAYIETIMKSENCITLFDGIGGASFDGSISTKSQVLRRLFDTHPGMDAENSLMVGDRKYDIIGAKEFSLRSVGVTFGYGSEDELKDEGADWIAHSVEELGELLLSI